MLIEVLFSTDNHPSTLLTICWDFDRLQTTN